MDFLDIFGQLDDPRIERKKLHPMPEILLLTLCAVICGAESWDDIEMFGKSKLDLLRQYLPYEYGVPGCVAKFSSNQRMPTLEARLSC